MPYDLHFVYTPVENEQALAILAKATAANYTAILRVYTGPVASLDLISRSGTAAWTCEMSADERVSLFRQLLRLAVCACTAESSDLSVPQGYGSVVGIVPIVPIATAPTHDNVSVAINRELSNANTHAAGVVLLLEIAGVIEVGLRSANGHAAPGRPKECPVWLEHRMFQRFATFC